MSKSSTPLRIMLLPGVSLPDSLILDLEEKGHIVDTYVEDEIKADIILGPQCYNTEGELSKKQLDVLTKSTRALVRAKKKAEREQAKLEKEKHGKKK